MEFSCPAYYEEFRCLGGSCPDSCCKEWSVCVDDESAARYRSLPGPLGDRLRAVLVEEDGDVVMAIQGGRCPMWRSDGLCRIQAELGEEALCRTCRDFPRICHDFGDFAELQLELSCPEAARLILEDEAGDRLIWQEPGDEEPEYDVEEMEAALLRREQVMDLLLDRELSPAQAMLSLLELTGVSGARETELSCLVEEYSRLETLTESWPRRLAAARPRPVHPLSRPLARYLVERYWLQGDLGEVRGKVCFIVSACLLLSCLEGDFAANAQLWSKEIENSDLNPQAIQDAAWEEGTLSPQALRFLTERLG